ncbi:hypothetical protein HGD80_03220 [Paulownia witches'-broom phytoplasma]|uniref:Uncharacterized protein n=1 Tax=Paulownia witches'-broom phytoplasma TaxID=39647 RepID=A0ABX8TMW4_9MOLU|nr:hypothetical protein [Paulownia witches'-broom phytoplasma]QYC30790.1 hypothetical protein HGD80_03220 [Paulownia witches'-broom phytoplasma]GLH60674.1 hypothetical protein PAWBP_4120 [Paulownia witches'-broom phytoplasma]
MRFLIIFQNPLSNLNPLIKVGKQIYESLQLKKTKSTHQQRKNQVLKFMEEVGMPEPMKGFSINILINFQVGCVKEL